MSKVLITVLWLLASAPLFAEQNTLERDLSQLMTMEVEVTSAMKRSQPIKDTAASIFVLERKEIELSGYNSVAELMKLLPGIDVRRIDNNQWAISIRSAAGRYNSNVLVMIDGRSLWEPGFNGILWEILNYPVEDIERIELVKSSGSLWSNNSTNGLVNIITRHTTDTKGSSLTVGLGNETHKTLTLRHSGYLSEQLSFRAYYHGNTGGTSHEKIMNSKVIEPFDRKKNQYYGVNLDYSYSDDLSFKFNYQHDDANLSQLNFGIDPETYGRTSFQDQTDFDIHNINFRVDHHLSEQLKYYIQAYYIDHHRRSLTFGDSYQSYTINSAANYSLEDHLISFGVDYSQVKRRIFNKDLTDDSLPRSTTYSVFVQDQYLLLDQQLKIILGTRFDHFNQHGWLAAPNFRLLYNLTSHSSTWLALSQGSRVASHYDEPQAISIRIPTLVPYRPTVVELNSKQLVDKQKTIEIGYRYSQPHFSFDLTLFAIDYRNNFILELDPATLTDAAAGTIYTFLSNQGSGNSSGLELTSTWQLNDALNILVGYSYIDFNTDPIEPWQSSIGGSRFNSHQIYSRIQYDLNDQFSLQAIAKHRGKNRVYQTAPYGQLDLSLHWRPSTQLKLSLIGQNLTQSHLVEFANEHELASASSALGRRIMLKATYHF